MKIGLLGFEFDSSNKGCEALSYALMPILVDIAGSEKLTIVNFDIHDSMGEVPHRYPNVSFINVKIHLKKKKFWKKCVDEMKSCDVVLDITHGDSFSDIYGKKWFIQTSILKSLVILLKRPLILMPQTYGPYESKWAKRWAKWIINRAKRAYCRDTSSARFLAKLCRNDPSCYPVVTDLAFALPFNKNQYSQTFDKTDQLIVGINISGLLWDDCEHQRNAYKLKTNYIEYCEKLIDQLQKTYNCMVYLVPHVICDNREGQDYYENDCKAIRKLINKFPKCKFELDFNNAEDVKSYTSNLDILIAARMHASIAAFSSGVITIPFAYSKKFKGVYLDLNYPYIIDGNNLTTEEAINKTIEYIKERYKLRDSSGAGLEKIKLGNASFETSLKNVLGRL